MRRRYNYTSIYKVFFVGVFLLISCSKDKSGTPKAIITTDVGQLKLGFYSNVAPKHVKNFIKLVEDGFYDGTTFHRVVHGFVIQGGDPKSKDNYIYDDGTGSPGYTIASEFNKKHFRGAVAMAKKPLKHNPKNVSNGSQFYIALDSLPNLDKDRHTVFGYIENGMEVCEKLLKLAREHGVNPNSSTKKYTKMSIEIIYEK